LRKPLNIYGYTLANDLINKKYNIVIKLGVSTESVSEYVIDMDRQVRLLLDDSNGYKGILRGSYPEESIESIEIAYKLLDHMDLSHLNKGEEDEEDRQRCLQVTTHSLTHPLTYSLTHSLTHLLTHLLTHSLTYLLQEALGYINESIKQPLVKLTAITNHRLDSIRKQAYDLKDLMVLTHSLTHPPTHPLTHSLILTYSLTHWLTYLLVTGSTWVYQ